MKTDIFATQIPHPELPAVEVTVKVTQCENRFEILAKPGAEIDSWQVQALLTRWLDSRIDAQKTGGHNRPNSISEA
jgi:hypothetical protein